MKGGGSEYIDEGLKLIRRVMYGLAHFTIDEQRQYRPAGWMASPRLLWALN